MGRAQKETATPRIIISRHAWNHDVLTDQITAEKIWRNLQDLLMRNGRILAKSELAFTYAREDLARAPRFTYARDDQGPHLGVCVHITTKADE